MELKNNENESLDDLPLKDFLAKFKYFDNFNFEKDDFEEYSITRAESFLEIKKANSPHSNECYNALKNDRDYAALIFLMNTGDKEDLKGINISSASRNLIIQKAKLFVMELLELEYNRDELYKEAKIPLKKINISEYDQEKAKRFVEFSEQGKSVKNLINVFLTKSDNKLHYKKVVAAVLLLKDSNKKIPSELQKYYDEAIAKKPGKYSFAKTKNS